MLSTDSLETSRNLLQAVLNHIEDPTIILDRNYQVILTNKKHVEMGAKITSNPLSKICYEVTHNRKRPCSGKNIPCPLDKVLKTKAPVTLKHTHFDSLYNRVFVEITASPILDQQGEVLYIIETYKNITGQNKIQSALQRSEMRYRSLFEQSGDAIFVLQAEGPQTGKILSANRAASLMHGYRKEEFLRLSIADLDTPEHAAKALKRIKRILEGEKLRMEISHKRKDGSVFPVEVSASMMEFGEKKFILALYRDISKRKAIEAERDTLIQKLKHISRTDGLTGLLNRQHIDIRLNEEMERARRYGDPLSLIMFDIDKFKLINDTYGHIAGDQILQRTSMIIKDTLRASDIAGRFGGDEFIIILVHTDIEVGMQVAERLRSRVAEENVQINDSQSTGYSISVGISQFDNSLSLAEDFIARADAALYEAKRKNRNIVVQSPPHQEPAC